MRSPAVLIFVFAFAQPTGGNDDGVDDLEFIFDGRTLDGWHAVPGDSASDWTVRDGAIVGNGSADRLAYLVWRDEQLTDFELKLSYRLPGKGLAAQATEAGVAQRCEGKE